MQSDTARARRGWTMVTVAGLACAFGAGFALAQDANAPPQAPSTPPASVEVTPLPPAAEPSPPAPVVAAPETPAAPAAPVAAAAPDAGLAAILEEVRRALAGAPRSGVDRADHAALAKFYEGRKEPLFVGKSGLKPAGQHLLAELGKAEDWGLNTEQLDVPKAVPDTAEPAALAALEVRLGASALKYARHARGARVDPQQLSPNLDQKLALRDPGVVMEALAASDTPGDYLTGLHPRHPQFQRLKDALAKARKGDMPAEPAAPAFVTLPDGPQLKSGSKHPHVVLLRQRLGLEARDDQIFDAELAEALKAFQREKGVQTSGQLTPRTRQLLNAGAPKPVAKAAPIVPRLVANMERWRWMPEDMGAFHVWQNTPEYAVRVVKGGSVIHQAKVIVGKTVNQTPVFSAPMRTIVFNPEWGVPNSIKVKEILPYLRPAQDDFFGGLFGGGVDTRVLEKHNLRISYGGRPVDPNSVKWGEVDIRRYTFIQPPGPTNVLGVVKFLFPNKHDVYMHDTPQRDLFTKDVRTFSHGCVRVQNPMKFAEVLLGEDKGWGAEQVQSRLAGGGGSDEVALSKPIPVHLSYFTTVVDDDGKLNVYDDIYNHDVRLIAALAGKYVPPEATAEPEAAPAPGKGKGKRKQAPLIENLW